MRRLGLEHVTLVEVKDAPPYVYADWLHAPGAPTVLVYGHHDVVPPGATGKWQSPPFAPVVRKGRLYGRGTADDKGGFMAWLAAASAYLGAAGALPVNLKLLIEGEEEIGSAHLADFLKAHRSKLDADVLVLSDTSNFATGVPALTWQLRGIVQVDVEVTCLERPVHSGDFGGAVPDAVRILCRILDDLRAPDGSIAVPGLYRDVARPSPRVRRRLRRLPFSEAAFRRGAGMLPGTKLVRERGYSVYEQVWTRPSLTVIALEAHPLAGAANQILDVARVRGSRCARCRRGHTARRARPWCASSRPIRRRARRSRRASSGSRPGGRRSPRAPRSRRLCVRSGRAMVGSRRCRRRRLDRLREALRRGAARRAVPAHRRRGPAVRRALGEREPPPRRLEEVDARRRAPAGGARRAAGAEVAWPWPVRSSLAFLASAASGAEGRGLPFWKALVGDCVVPEGESASALVGEAVALLGSPSSEWRDDVGYGVVASCVYQKRALSGEERRALVERLSANLRARHRRDRDRLGAAALVLGPRPLDPGGARERRRRRSTRRAIGGSSKPRSPTCATSATCGGSSRASAGSTPRPTPPTCSSSSPATRASRARTRQRLLDARCREADHALARPSSATRKTSAWRRRSSPSRAGAISIPALLDPWLARFVAAEKQVWTKAPPEPSLLDAAQNGRSFLRSLYVLLSLAGSRRRRARRRRSLRPHRRSRARRCWRRSPRSDASCILPRVFVSAARDLRAIGWRTRRPTWCAILFHSRSWCRQGVPGRPARLHAPREVHERRRFVTDTAAIVIIEHRAQHS